MTPFPQYKKGVPKAGLDDITQWMAALMIAAVPYFFATMILGNGLFGTVISSSVGFLTFKALAVPMIRYLFNRLPPLYLQHSLKTVMFRGGLHARPDPDPVPLSVK